MAFSSSRLHYNKEPLSCFLSCNLRHALILAFGSFIAIASRKAMSQHLSVSFSSRWASSRASWEEPLLQHWPRHPPAYYLEVQERSHLLDNASERSFASTATSVTTSSTYPSFLERNPSPPLGEMMLFLPTASRLSFEDLAGFPASLEP